MAPPSWLQSSSGQDIFRGGRRRTLRSTSHRLARANGATAEDSDQTDRAQIVRGGPNNGRWMCLDSRNVR